LESLVCLVLEGGRRSGMLVVLFAHSRASEAWWARACDKSG